MPTSPYAKAGLLALGLLTSIMIGWEIFLRQQGFILSYNDDEALWAHHRSAGPYPKKHRFLYLFPILRQAPGDAGGIRGRRLSVVCSNVNF